MTGANKRMSMGYSSLNTAMLLGPLLMACGGQVQRPPPVSPAQPTGTETEAGTEAGTGTETGYAEHDQSMANMRWRLENELDPSQLSFLALPASWPPSDGTLVFFIYSSEPLPTGRVMYRIEGPVAVARIQDKDRHVRIEEILTTPMVVKRPGQSKHVKDKRAVAESLLLEVVAGRTSLADGQAELHERYCDLLDDGAVGKDLRARAPEFVAWLACDPFSGHKSQPQIRTAE